ncbi:MAG: efflux RND transporter periplasmic adaptor subunit [Myxococcota bacterium]
MKRELAVLPAAALLALAACGAEQASEEVVGRPVTLSPVLAVDLDERIEASGQLLAKDRAEIAAEVGGRITEILIDEGGGAELGAAVITIDPERRKLERDRTRARLDEARAARSEQEREFARIGELHERNVASQTQLEQAETGLVRAASRLLAAEAEFGVARRALQDATVRAPFAGLIARRLVSRGEFVSPGHKLFELVALDPIQVEFHLPEVDSSRVRVGHPVEVTVAPYPGEVFRANLTLVSPTIDPRTRTLRVQAQLPNGDGRLRPGLFARVDLGVAKRRGVPMIPEEAVLQRSDGAVVFRIDSDNRVERLVIETGAYWNGSVEVKGGLATGDLVVSRGHSALVDGELVVPRHPDGTPLRQSLPTVAEAGENAS